MYCCANCFGDSFLNKHILQSSKQTDTCNFCGTVGVAVVEPSSLLDFFQPIFALYTGENASDGKPLEQWFKDDWDIFLSLDSIKASSLLAEILDDGEAVRKKYLPRSIPAQTAVEAWETFRDKIKFENRFFIDHELNLDRLKQLFSTHLEVNESIFKSKLYRARIQAGDLPIPESEMGKPSSAQAKFGRANPVGIPYLYAASTAETAIAETRPHPGDVLTVAQFDVTSLLWLLDLRFPRKTISPFIIDESDLVEARQDLSFLSLLANELSKPILPRSAELEYLPTQYLCEFIKNCDYDGVVFKSSISDGSNIALFDDKKVSIVKTYRYQVTQVKYIQEKIDD